MLLIKVTSNSASSINVNFSFPFLHFSAMTTAERSSVVTTFNTSPDVRVILMKTELAGEFNSLHAQCENAFFTFIQRTESIYVVPTTSYSLIRCGT